MRLLNHQVLYQVSRDMINVITQLDSPWNLGTITLSTTSE